ncbi:oligosaccharyl transferase, archaeosortase A system-associated [Halosegnis sp.]|uniref:oligosaccharyl transferase, archaeosortase A system-associated n=1 Tax=Halosegnis sp. TaxID=2864959 RepID=UPI0035D41A6B
MSRLSDRLAAEADSSVLDLLRDYYHVPLLALAVAVSLWIRTRGWRNFVTDSGVLFSGNDPWYHYRMVQYTVANWPFTMPFDPWTGYPTGTSVGQFGTLFDQLIATAALVVGLGSPSEHTIAMVHLFAPAVFGALALLPAYALTARVTDRLGGLIAVLFLSLTTGQFLTRGVVGFSDHHIAEVFFFTLAAAAVALALRVALAEKPVWELVVAREFDPLRKPVGYAALAGIAITLYLWTWPPGVFLLGVLGIFFAVAASIYQASGTSPDHVALPGIVIGLVVAILTLVTIDTFTLSAVKLSLLQPLLGVGLAVGSVFLAALARVWEANDVDPRAYPLGVLGVAVIGLGAFALVFPEAFDFFRGQVLRIFGYDATAASRTVAEAKPVPLDSLVGFFSNYYGFGLFTAVAGALVMLYTLAVADEPRADRLFLLVVTLFMFLAAITQRRFEYYFVIPVAVLNGYLASTVFDIVGLRQRIVNLERPTGYQVMAVVAVLLVVAAPMTVGARTAPSVANQQASPGGVQQWTASLDWMEENTPAMGAYGDGSPGEMEYYGTYEPTDDFEYEDGNYGTLAWWDYGHWITVLSKRVPNANPFQQNAGFAADVLLAPDEDTAVEMLENGGSEETRYVIVDYPLGVPGTRKYSAPTAFESRYDIQPNDLRRTIFDRGSVEQAIRQGDARLVRRAVTLNRPRAYDSLRVRLYQFHGSRISPRSNGQVVVFDWATDIRGVPTTPAQGNLTKTFQNRSAAEDFVAADGTSQIGGTPNLPAKTVPALEHFRLVHASNESRIGQGRQVYAAVKTFERVPGATVRVEGPPNTTVIAAVQMEMTARDRQRLGLTGDGRISTVSTGRQQTFVYRQQARTNGDGVATFTLPYSTTGYEAYGTEAGYTNVSVRATGPYRFSTPVRQDSETLTTYYFNATADVTEGQVIGENESTTTVELERTVLDKPEGANNTSASLTTPSLPETSTEPQDARKPATDTRLIAARAS